MNQTTLISEQFGACAQGYLTSEVHAEGTDLQRLSQLTANLSCRQALDLGCGAGHTAFAMAKAGASVTAYDLSPNMLALVATEAARRGLTGITTQLGSAESLPFADASFDLVATRFSAHHWNNVPAAIQEARRVLKPSGTLVVIDVIAAENPLFDTVLQTVEILADASHIRDYRVSEWQTMFQTAGFAKATYDTWTLAMEFTSWVARKHTSSQRIAAVHEVLDKTSDEVRQYFKIQPDHSFNLDIAWLQTQPS